MSQVFEAYDRNLNRHVAVKIARPGTPAVLHAEGMALAAIHHPALVTVFHMGVHEGSEYLVLERIGGQSLRQRLDEVQPQPPQLPLEEAVAIVGAIAAALTVVHAAGLSHRDIKPDNVMLAPGDRIVLMDFGLTRPEFDRPGGEGISGSPDYMAPEAILGTVRRGEGHLVDLYALGIVIYELLAGYPPFSRTHWSKTLLAQLEEPAPDLRATRSDVPEALAELVACLLEKDPELRPDSAEAVESTLRALAGATPGSRDATTLPSRA
jgi:serine/threonine-protein kinase